MRDTYFPVVSGMKGPPPKTVDYSIGTKYIEKQRKPSLYIGLNNPTVVPGSEPGTY